MGEYSIVAELRFSKFFPLFTGIYQLMVIAFWAFGCLVAPPGFVLAYIFQFCSLYYVGLSLCAKFYKLRISPNLITVRNIFSKEKSYGTDNLRWKIGRIPWYNSYYVLLYSSRRIPIAIVKPHWKNALRILRFPHLGKLSTMEIEYLKFLKSAGLLN